MRGWPARLIAGVAFVAIVAAACESSLVEPPTETSTALGTPPESEPPKGAAAANAEVEAANEPRGWGLLQLEATIEAELAGRDGEVFRPGPDEVFVVVDLRLEKLRPGERTAPTTGVSLIDADDFAWPATGFGEEDAFCVGCTVEFSTTDRVVPVALVFEMPFADAAGALVLTFEEAGTGVAGWQRIEPGGRTECARGGEYAFWVHRGDPDRLLVFFQGGGGCFDYRSCAPDTALFDPEVGDGDDPAFSGAGVLDLSRRDNPFAGWTVVFIPSCTGDVHWGDAVQTYRSEGGEEVTIQHRGFVNARAALDWAYRNVTEPGRVFLSGCSAGSPGSMAHSPYVIEQYPDAAVTQLGDSLAFVFHRPIDLQEDYRAHDNFAPWIPELEKIRPGKFTTAEYYLAVSGHYPRHTFGQVNFSEDAVQTLFYEAVGGDPENFPADLRLSLDRIRGGAPNFVSYTAPGSRHCVLDQFGFFTLEVDGVPLRDWVADLAEGRVVDHVGA